MSEPKEGEMFEAVSTWAGVIFRLGLEVYKAIKAGNTTKTVGEIFADVKRDVEKIEELDALAVAHFAQRGEAEFAEPEDDGA